jgi:hypothetical protein
VCLPRSLVCLPQIERALWRSTDLEARQALAALAVQQYAAAVAASLAILWASQGQFSDW